MCAIIGFFGRNNVSIKENLFLESLLYMKNRGPDGISWLGIDRSKNISWNEYKGKKSQKEYNIIFGSARLALIDVSNAGLQPIKSNNGQFWVVLNGEIFNYLEIKKELLSLNYQFKSKTDTEVIANSYQEWGVDAFSKFNGQFSFSIYDVSANKLILCRDRIGIVPLFFKKNSSCFAFSTQLKALNKLFDHNNKINHKQLIRQLSLPYKLHSLSDQTLYEDVFSLPPASFMKIDLNNFNIIEKKYWDINCIKEDYKSTFNELKYKLSELLIDSVKIRLRTDKEYAFILSGGVDSSSVLGIAKQELNAKLKTFSLSLPDKRFNEDDSIKDNLKFNGLSDNFIYLNPELIMNKASSFIEKCDDPLATPNCLLHSIMAEEISKSNISVVLNGVGGDEALLGYHDHFLYHLYNLELRKDKSFSQELHCWSLNQKKSIDVYYKFKLFMEGNDYQFTPDFLARSAGFDYRKLISSNFKKEDYNNQKNIFKNSSSPIIKQMNDINFFTIPHSIKMDDYCYLQNGVEARQPFLDHRLIELALSIPHKYKIKKGINKFILRQAMKKYIPSNAKNNIKKVGLNYPIDNWMRSELREWVYDNCGNKNDLIYNYINYDAVIELIDQHMKNKQNHSLKIWDICSINQWLKNQ